MQREKGRAHPVDSGRLGGIGFLTALSQGISLAFGLSKDLSFWTVGSLSGILWPQVRMVIPWLLAAEIVGILLSPKLSLLSLGDESAAGLGVNVGAVRILALLSY